MSTVASRSIPWRTDASDTAVERRAGSRVQAFPAGQVISLDVDDVDDFNRHAAGWSVEYHVLDATAFKSRLFLVTTPSLQVAHVEHAMGYSSQGQNPAGTFSAVIPTDGALPMIYRGRSIGATQMALIRSGDEYECVARAGARFVTVSLAQEMVERYAADLLHEPGLLAHSPDQLRFVDAAHRSRYLAACGRILAAVDEQPGVLAHRRTAALLEEKVLEGLLLSAHVVSPSVHERGRYRLARQAYRYLQDRADEVPSIRELCSITGASYATLERGFRETYGMTPKAMTRAMRLAGARRALLHSGPTTTVTAVALQWGFVEFGRFSGQYCRRYGEVPRETLRRARGESPRLNRM